MTGTCLKIERGCVVYSGEQPVIKLMSNDAQAALGCLMSNAARIRVNTKLCKSTFTSPTHATSKQNNVLIKIIFIFAYFRNTVPVITLLDVLNSWRKRGWGECAKNSQKLMVENGTQKRWRANI